jgi:hypothetical protein
LNYYYDEDGSLVIRVQLPAEEGAVVLQALNAAIDARYAEHNEVEPDDVTANTRPVARWNRPRGIIQESA